jgi:hypothetical protein
LSTECYAVFSSNGAVTNSGITYVTGDVGTNVGLTTGFNALYVTGTIHPIPDGSTAACAADLLTVYNYLSTLPYDIELLYPAQFGSNLVLTPHTYLMNAATVFTDTLYLDALGNVNGVFVIRINGALSTSTYSKVILINGTRAENVFWVVEGAVDINDYSIFNGTVICNNGAISLNTGVTLNGRALTTTGNLTTSAITATMPPGCTTTGTENSNDASAEPVSIFPNPFSDFMTIVISETSPINTAELILYNVLGEAVLHEKITQRSTRITISGLPSGIYFYAISGSNKLIHSGKVISQQ